MCCILKRLSRPALVLVLLYREGLIGRKGRFWCAASNSVNRTCSTSTLFIKEGFLWIMYKKKGIGFCGNKRKKETTFSFTENCEMDGAFILCESSQEIKAQFRYFL